MTGRDIAAHVFGGLLIVAVIAGLYAAAVTSVTVPLIWPLATTLLCVAGAAIVIRRARTRYRAEREIETQRPHPVVRPTVQGLLDRPRTGNRIGDAERDIVVGALRAHFAAGRLSQTELEERLALTLNAQTLEHLAAAVRNMPSEVTGR